MFYTITRVGSEGGVPSRSWQSELRCLSILLVALLFTDAARAGTLSEVMDFGSNPGNLRMFMYIPDQLRATPPLVVVLHGCRQSGATYAEEAGWTKFADQWRFALLLPDQKTDNHAWKCFNWFEPGDYQRDRGEARSIQQMIEKMKTDYHVNPSQVYVTGLSAGGAMACVMMAAYPEEFAGGGIIAGLPYRCAANPGEAVACMKNGKDLGPAEWGDLVRSASRYTGPWPRVSIWHGDNDTTVNPNNAKALMVQWTNVHDIDQIPEQVEKMDGILHRTYQDHYGNALVETYKIKGMEHGAPVSPGSGAEQGGVVAPFMFDVKICSTYRMVKFWGLQCTAPAIEITAPVQGTVLSGSVTLKTQHPANMSMKLIDYCVDGKAYRTDAAPEWTWDTTTTTDGVHVLAARAIDMSQKVWMSDPITVHVAHSKSGAPERKKK
jgi:poly(hydroxyalkanoate) depolymerase family esterase